MTQKELRPRPTGRRVRSTAGMTSRVATPLIRSSPLSHLSATLDVRNVCVRSPVCGSVFSDTAVRVLAWKGRVAAGFKGAVQVVLMAAMVALSRSPVHVQVSENRT